MSFSVRKLLSYAKRNPRVFQVIIQAIFQDREMPLYRRVLLMLVRLYRLAVLVGERRPER